MGEVHCLYSWDAKKAKQLLSWVSADEQRYALFLETDPTKVILQTPHPRLRSIFVSSEEVLIQIAREFLFLPFTFASSHELLLTLSQVQTQISYQAFPFADQGIAALQNLKSNLSTPFSSGAHLSGAYRGIPAIVCGRGPSLKNLTSTNALVIGCGAGVDALLQQKLRPHFAVHVDPDPSHTFSPCDIPLLFQLKTSAKTVSLHKGPRFLMAGAGHLPIESDVQEKLSLPASFDGGWTAGTFGVAMALFLGCNPIFLAGLDGFTTKKGEGLVPYKNGFSRPDWIFAADWLNCLAKAHPEVTWGNLGKDGLEMTSIPHVKLAPFEGVKIPELVTAPTLHTNLWDEIAQSSRRSLRLCKEILQEMEKIYPQHPHENGTCTLLEHDLYEELFTQKVLDPVWRHWQYLIKRHNQAEEAGLYLNRILLFSTLCEKVDALS
jgi:hypothetical protein